MKKGVMVGVMGALMAGAVSALEGPLYEVACQAVTQKVSGLDAQALQAVFHALAHPRVTPHLPWVENLLDRKVTHLRRDVLVGEIAKTTGIDVLGSAAPRMAALGEHNKSPLTLRKVPKNDSLEGAIQAAEARIESNPHAGSSVFLERIIKLKEEVSAFQKGGEGQRRDQEDIFWLTLMKIDQDYKRWQGTLLNAL